MMKGEGDAISRTSTTAGRRKWNAKSFIYFFMSEGGDVFPCIETRGVNLYA